MNKSKTKLLALLCILTLVIFFFLFDLHEMFTIENLSNLRTQLDYYLDTSPLITITIFFLIFVIGVSLSLPVAGILTITGGAVFGLLWGTVIVVIAGCLGACISFLISRYLFRDYVQDRYGEKIRVINEGIARHGAVFLFSLRLFPIIPYFIINAVMGLTSISATTFGLISLIGMIPVTVIFVNAGTKLASIHSVQDIMSLQIILSFALIAIIPLLAHRFGYYSKLLKTNKD